MATPTTTARRAQGFGAPHFLVRGVDFTSEESLAIIRPLITDYPERVTQNPLFPFPGRRGGSRPRDEVLALESLPHDPIFPQPRAREKGADQPLGGVLPPDDSPGASPVLACLGAGGTHYQDASGIVAGADLSVVTVPLTRPFVIRFVSFFCDTTDVNNISARVVVAPNSDLSAGFNSAGFSIDQGSSGTIAFRGVASTQVSYPNLKWTSTPAFIKFLVRNLGATTITIQWIANIEWLD
jgi:hypothetical protein